MRKIVQIAFDTYSKYERDSDYQNITSTAYALLDDGTVYYKDDAGNWYLSNEFDNLINEINEEEEK